MSSWNPDGHRGFAPPLASQVAHAEAVDKVFEDTFPIQDTKLRDSLFQTTDHSIASSLPGIAVSPSVARFMVMQCKLLKAQNVLEVGTLGGYSTIWFAAGAGCRVTTLEYNEDYARVARENLDAAGVGDRVEVVVGDATETMARIVEEIQKGERARPELVFIDANKDADLVYYNLGVEAVGPGGIVIVDNMVKWGEVVDEEKLKAKDPTACGIRELMEFAGKDERVDATVIRTLAEDCYDGFLYAVVKS